jgi:hypothetical protein
VPLAGVYVVPGHSMSRLLTRLLPVVSVFAVAAVLAGEVLFSQFQHESFHDWDHHAAYAEAATAAVRQHQELPFWNPYLCGGVPQLAHPESRVLTPSFLLYLALPVGTAMKWDIALHFGVAALGMALLLFQERAPLPAVIVGALVFGGSTFMSLHAAEGHTWILPVAFAPLVIAFYERGHDRLLWAGVAGFFLALVVGDGGIYPAPHLALFLSLYAAGQSLVRRSWRPLLVLGVTAGVAALLAAPKLLPLLTLMGRAPRLVASEEVLPLRAFFHVLIDRDQAMNRRFDWPYWPWHEQGSYVGLLALLLAAVALLKAERRSLVLGSVALIFALIAAGSFASWAPWTLLHKLPLFRSQHVPSRFLALAVMAVAILAARGSAALLEWSPSSRLRTGLGLLLVLFVGADILSARAGILRPLRCPRASWPTDAPTGKPIVTLQRSPALSKCGAYSGLAPAVTAGVAIIDAYEPLCPRDGGVVGRRPGLYGMGTPGYQGEAWVVGSGTVELTSRTQNTLTLKVSPEASGTVVFNQNWDPGWRSDKGQLLEDAQGRMTLTLEPDQRVYALRYRPPYFFLSVALCALGLLILGVLWRYTRSAPHPPQQHEAQVPPAISPGAQV